MRTTSIDSIVRDFIVTRTTKELTSGHQLQVLSLGAGFDTRFFRLTDQVEEFQFPSRFSLKYFEIDFESVIDTKRSIISKNEILQTKSSYGLNLIPFDLNTVSDNIEVFNAVLIEAGFDFSCPTLVVSECCFMYLTAEAGNSLISWAASLKTSIICSFDPILSDNLEKDHFAQVMLDNFEDRGLDTRTLLAYPSINAVSCRFQTHFTSINAFTMLELEQSIQTRSLVSDEQRRILNIKAALDEYEEWHLLASHYLLVISSN